MIGGNTLSIHNKANRKNKQKFIFYTHLSNEYNKNISFEKLSKLAKVRYRILKNIESNNFDLCKLEDREHDIVTHFALKLIAVQANWSRKWFINQEVRLFSYRIRYIDYNDLIEQANSKFFPYYHNDNSTKITMNAYFDPDNKLPTSTIFNYKEIHFTKCSEVLPNRADRICDLNRGYVIKNWKSLPSLLITEFRNYLDKSMNDLYEVVVNNSDERLVKMNSEIFALDNYTDKKTVGTISNIVNSPNLPLCIKEVIDKLNTVKHLKYDDRLVLIRFLKDFNIPVDDVIQFMRNKLPTMNDKELVYVIRHCYGLEGKKKNYNCFNCVQLFNFKHKTNATGCPFIKNKSYVERFVDIEDSADYQGNCKKHFATLLRKELKENLNNLELKNEDIQISSPVTFFRNINEIIKKNKKV
ncbi:PRI2 [Hepatospora eriocheir]|uniref:PRI2 n=1 Tax=Hepatospora eriocheir TaxID=1081669 RepID=A0A1X0QI23_9MICR|nr:PRI2 [Hepatospora eriocheir]